MAFSVGIGMAIAAKHDGRSSKIYLLLGDGECDEGSNWEAFLAAPNLGLDNLTVIIDANRLQYDGLTDEVMSLVPFSEKLIAFGWDVLEIDGHSVSEIYRACSEPRVGKPRAIIAHTIKGKGVSFMESKKEWHHGVLSDKNYQAALEEQRGSR
jgi:transketolase